jgi:FHS family L-fucose permease-like MFS transporter
VASLGGALGPVIIGNLGDLFGLGVSLNYLFLPLLVVFSVAFWAKPLITNKTFNRKGVYHRKEAYNKEMLS